MQMETTTRLRKGNTSYKLFIPKEVEIKIRMLCTLCPNKEWSGILFYKLIGSFTDNNLEIHCVDIYQMDEGNATYTEFDMNPDVAGYIVDHPELCKDGIYQALIHSHNNMPTFFSGTDLDTLYEQGEKMYHFVSLIVNNVGNYTAAITRQVEVENKVQAFINFTTFNDKKEQKENSYTEHLKYIEYFNLEIYKDTASDNNELLDRFNEIRRNKENSLKQPSFQNTLFDKKNFDVPKFPITRSDNANLLMKKSLTCNIFISDSTNLNINNWLDKMDTNYSKAFGDMATFETFAVNFADFVLQDAASTSINASEDISKLAQKIIDEFSLLPRTNVWINTWISIYEEFIL